MLSPAVTNILVMLVMMQLSRRIDLDNEQNLLYIRAAYVISAVSALLVYQFVKQKVIAKNDQTKIEIVTPKNPMKPDVPEKVEYKTTKDYDVSEIDAAMKSIFTGAAMMGFMHFYMKFNNPLFMQCINPIKGALEHNVTRIHLWGAKPEGELKRPFKSAGLFDAFTKKPEEQKPHVAGSVTSSTGASSTGVSTGASTGVSSRKTAASPAEPKIVELNDEPIAATVAAE